MTTAVVTTEAPQEQVAARPAQGSRRRPPRVNRPVGGAGASVLLWGYAALALVPLLLMVSNSFRTNADLITDPLGLPAPPTTASYVEAWTTGNFATYFGNSLLVTVGAVAISTAVATMAAYALARGRSRIFRWLEALFLSGLMLPIHLAILPIFYLFDGLGLIDSRLGLMLMYAASGIPFSIFVLTTFFRQLPEELEEAAALDGASSWQTFWRIMVPLVRPALATVAVFRFVPIWNDFLFPLVLLRSEDKYTLPVGLTSFFGENATNYSAVFAGLVITTVPLIVLFLVATKQIVAGLTAGMAK
ncbi:sugar ABC transporter permease [Terrabacter sp. Root85]|jgi:raffinose/stachyose/melibiose transport system permease protein|uniref:carbohydrate ABC transporter permease n=1 Tax=unclassified Terrabacter TaxID=2630222 RepID=UPI0006F2CF7D|nr:MULTISPECIES: carbohydrate ABC transporter permease [unclassified Terrabacter]KRC92273.1 sugar ABC transporter permease [Terrabacter sp. Root85]KRF48960.1 sugar ABC transporter permease [Terrabacter sp. Soil811]